ncbi:MAG TPA: glycosyltransferase family 4 protein [Ruminococcus sp.]|nr:glycosyltransferase family 4 protein [Ruminococcus sp.]
MIKIILYSSSQLKKIPKTGGVKRFLELVNQMGKFCQLTLLSGDEEYPVPKEARHISMHQNKVYNKEAEYARHNRKYLKNIKKEGYDSIVAFDVPPAIWLALYRMPHLCLMVRKDLIGYKKIILANQKVNGIKKFCILKVFSIAELITLLYAEKIIVQCEYDRDELIKRHSVFAKCIRRKTTIQINNVNPSWAKASNAIKERTSTKFRIVSVNGFSDYRKGCDIFLEAISNLLDKGYNIEAYIAGDGTMLSDYQKKYKKYRDIHFSGRIDKPGDYIKQFDLAVVPSRADSCPNTIMEALLNEVPVIGSNVGGIPEILADNTVLFESNAASLKEKILYCMVPENLSRITDQQKKRRKQLQFDWSKRIFDIINGDK